MEVIGLDVGGTSVKGARFDEAGKIVCEASAPTPAQEGREAIFGAIFAVIDRLIERDVASLGISSAGNIDPATGTCVYATENLRGWTGAPVAARVSARYGLPCHADNDAVCALKGELTLLADARDVTMLTFGTGVGGASLVNGKIVRGKNFDGARWGHVVLVPDGAPCSCGKRGCAESYLSAAAILRAGRERIPALADVKELFFRFGEGERAAEEALSPFRTALNRLLSVIRTAVAPSVILLGGGIAQSQQAFLRLIEDSSDIAFARLGVRAGIYGAAYGEKIGE